VPRCDRPWRTGTTDDHIEAWLEAHTDGAVERDGSGNVLARRNGGADADRSLSLALVGHHDVVPPDAGTTDAGEYVLEERDGRLYRRSRPRVKAVRFSPIGPKPRVQLRRGLKTLIRSNCRQLRGNAAPLKTRVFGVVRGVLSGGVEPPTLTDASGVRV
jgi:hypothetical protein